MKHDYKKYIKDINDFPKKGIVFRDIATLLYKPTVYKDLIDDMSELAKDADVIVAIEARGFMFGPSIAMKLGVPFVMIRKENKLPGKVLKETYDLEYGQSAVEMQDNAILKENANVIIIDDILATGGTSLAAVKLIESKGHKVIGLQFLADLTYVTKIDKLNEYDVKSIIKY